MPPPVFELALAHVADQLRISLDSDPQTAQLSDLMMAEEQIANVQLFVKELYDAWVNSGDDLRARNDVLRREANYFDRNAGAVAYAAYRERGWSTASSEVECAHRHVVQHRLKIPGASWWRPAQVDCACSRLRTRA